MEVQESAGEQAPELCINCNHYKPLEGHNSPLCTYCRKSLINYPIPTWLRISFGIVMLVVVYAISEMPSSLIAAIHLKKGEKALVAKRPATALKEFLKADAKLPGSALVHSRLLAGYVSNYDFNNAFRVLDSLKKMDSKDKDIVDFAMDYISTINLYYKSDEQYYAVVNNPELSKDSLMGFMRNYMLSNPYNGDVKYHYASLLYDVEKYEDSKLYLDFAISQDYSFNNVYLLKAACERQLGNYDKGLEWCDKVIKGNVESVEAYAAKAKICLRKKDMPMAKTFLDEAMVLNEQGAYVNSVAALYYGMLKDEANLQKHLDILRSLGAEGEYYLKSVNSILSGEKSI
ncbi:MAG: tetratricopeptide repeat protein [Cytophagaceae bacterium]